MGRLPAPFMQPPPTHRALQPKSMDGSVDDAIISLLTGADMCSESFCAETDVATYSWHLMHDPRRGDLIKMIADTSIDDGTVQILLSKEARGEITNIGPDGDMEICFPGLLTGCHYSFPRWFAT